LSRRLKILITIDWFLPAYKAGGPIQSIANLLNRTKDDFDYYVATSNSDLYQPLDLEKESLNMWQSKDGYRIVYLDPAHQTLKYYKQLFLVENFDVIYMNSLFSKKFTLLPLLIFKNKPIRKVLAPRGMLGEGALKIKPIKKNLFLKVFKALNVHHKVNWHATAQSEVNEIIKHFGQQCKVVLAPNLSTKIESTDLYKLKDENKINVFFLSRIAIKKNLLSAITYLAQIHPKFDVNFSIIGPIDEAIYWKNCCAEIEKLPSHICVNYLGAIPHHEITKHLKNQHVLLLPTQHENFGHVIMESWQNGCPVIISDQTPWRELQKDHLGFDIPLAKPDKFSRVIEQMASMSENQFNNWVMSSVNFAQKFTNNPKLIEQNKALFLVQ
jgi:glycosyltransferase involved in cell wall biosynthesis